MKAVIQRVSQAFVAVDGQTVGKIGRGSLIFLGVAQEDTEKDLEVLVKKTADLRIFDDEEGKANLSLCDIDGEALVISQFTLLASCKKGRRPSFVKAGDPQKAESMYREFIKSLGRRVRKVDHGVFGAKMEVSLVNDGPFTILLDTKEL